MLSSTPSRLAQSRPERKERFSILLFFNEEIFIRAINTLRNLPSVITIVAVDNIFPIVQQQLRTEKKSALHPSIRRTMIANNVDVSLFR